VIPFGKIIVVKNKLLLDIDKKVGEMVTVELGNLDDHK